MRCAVELGHELPVGGAGGGEVVVAVVEFACQVSDVLFKVFDALLEGVDVDGRAEAGGVPGLLAECVG